MWPLADCVAVNPLVGYTSQHFVAARGKLARVSSADPLPTVAYFRAALAAGAFADQDVARALAETPDSLAASIDGLTPEGIMAIVRGAASAPPKSAERAVETYATRLDRSTGVTGRIGLDWESEVVDEVSRHCAAHYDRGQAAWRSPWRDATLYASWRDAALVDRRFEVRGCHDFRKFVATLPQEPHQAVAHLLGTLGVPVAQAEEHLLAALYSVAGWASYIQHRVRGAGERQERDEDLVGLLAIRMAYDAGLAVANPRTSIAPTSSVAASAALPTEVALRYTLLVACEIAYRRKLLGTLARPMTPLATTSRKTAQLVFCIDVRSEVFRRQLESVSADLETFGFAGFFGLALELVPLGAERGVAQCPVLLQPSFRVCERIGDTSAAATEDAIDRRQETRLGRKTWKSFQASAASCFSFVESVGLAFLPRLIRDALGMSPSPTAARRDGLVGPDAEALVPRLASEGPHAVSLERRVAMAEGVLRNLGLVEGFASIVAFCGHGSTTTNNPYRAGLDCGACGGHTGESNARVAAALLNDPQVRAGLAERGVAIPSDTLFVAGLHNTTTDAVTLFDAPPTHPTHGARLEELRRQLADTGRLARAQRATRLATSDPESLVDRSRDWAEVRPEWGLAGNAAFIVAPRQRTKGLDLGGRTFLHSYEHTRDADLAVLELVMTAPMVVANWINMQYFASAADNATLGSGDKTLHNVVGGIGVLEGNGGDLRVGLPWQSVHDGASLAHQPLRLLVVIEAPRESIDRVIAKHSLVSDLVLGEWLHVVAIEGDEFHQWTAAGWIEAR
jgi:uncharacterized protein YbcC (UPF0753/DUF2309 family)